MLKRIGLSCLIAFLGIVGFEIGGNILAPGSITVISTAEARVGRPLTPVSVAGVGRRTVRRCAAGVYRC